MYQVDLQEAVKLDMDISGISSASLQAIAGTSTQNGDAVSISVLKKAMDLQAAQASQLIQSVTQSTSPPELSGQHIDIYA